MEDQQSGPGDLTTEDTPAADRPRRRLFGRRSKKSTVEPAAVSETESTESDPAADAGGSAPKAPMGKAARTARTRGPRTESDAETAQDAAEAPAAPVENVEPIEAVEGDDVAPSEQAPSEQAPSERAETESAETDVDAEPDPSEPVVLVPHRPVGKGLIAAATAASVVFVGAGAFAAAMAQPYLAQQALVQTKLDIARTATDAISTLWTYTPDDMATLADRASGFLAGDFAGEYRRYIDAIVEPNKQAQVTNTTQVMGAAVESVSPPSIPTEATALVYTNSVATSPVTKNIPALRYLSYRLTMQRDGGDWRIIRMSTITSFDLTPQL